MQIKRSMRRVLTIMVLLIVAAWTGTTLSFADTGQPDSWSVKIPVTYTASGGRDSASYTFQLERKSADAPMPSGTEISLKNGETKSFGEIRITRPGEYYYTVRRLTAPENAVKADRSVYTVRVIAYSDGTVQQVYYRKNGDGKAEAVRYTDRFQSGGIISIVPTGDDGSNLRWLLGGLAAMLLLLGLIRKQRRTNAEENGGEMVKIHSPGRTVILALLCLIGAFFMAASPVSAQTVSVVNDPGDGSAYESLPKNEGTFKNLSLHGLGISSLSSSGIGAYSPGDSSVTDTTIVGEKGAVKVSGDYRLYYGYPGDADNQAVLFIGAKGARKYGSNPVNVKGKNKPWADGSAKANKISGDADIYFEDAIQLTDGTYKDLHIHLSNWTAGLGELVNIDKKAFKSKGANTSVYIPIFGDSSPNGKLQFMSSTPRASIGSNYASTYSGAYAQNRVKVSMEVGDYSTTANGASHSHEVSFMPDTSAKRMLFGFSDLDIPDRMISAHKNSSDDVKYHNMTNRYEGEHSESVSTWYGFSDKVVLGPTSASKSDIKEQTLEKAGTDSDGNTRIHGDGSQYAKYLVDPDVQSTNSDAKAGKPNDKRQNYLSGFTGSVPFSGWGFIWTGSATGGGGAMGTLLGAKPIEIIPELDPVFTVNKTSTSESYRYGKPIHYVITAEQTAENSKAGTFDIHDDLSEGNLELVDDSIKIKTENGATCTKQDLKSGETGFRYQMASPKGQKGKVTIEYDAKVKEGYNGDILNKVNDEPGPTPPSVADLTISKNVKGNLGVVEKNYEFTVDLSGLAVKDPVTKKDMVYSVSENSLKTVETGEKTDDGFKPDANGNAKLTFVLNDDESITLEELQAADDSKPVTYRVNEAASDLKASYKQTGTNPDAAFVKASNKNDKDETPLATEMETISAETTGDVTVAYTNTKILTPPTGVASNGKSLTVMGLTVLAIVGICYESWYLRRRKKNSGIR